MWKAQVPYLARHHRVITFDPRGNGRSDRPSAPAEYGDTELVADVLAVLDATGTDRAVCVGLSKGGRVLLQLAALHPDRVSGAIFLAPALPLDGSAAAARTRAFETDVDDPVGWAKFNVHHWRRDLGDFAEFFFSEVFPEPHSSNTSAPGLAISMSDFTERSKSGVCCKTPMQSTLSNCPAAKGRS